MYVVSNSRVNVQEIVKEMGIMVTHPIPSNLWLLAYYYSQPPSGLELSNNIGLGLDLDGRPW